MTTGEQAVNGVAGVAMTGGAAWLSVVGDVALQLLGVPLPVVMAAVGGSLLARSYLPTLTFWAALGRSALWMVIGCVGAQGLSAVVAVTGSTPAVGLLGILALAISGLGPKAWPVLVAQTPIVVKTWTAKLGGSQPPPEDPNAKP